MFFKKSTSECVSVLASMLMYMHVHGGWKPEDNHGCHAQDCCLSPLGWGLSLVWNSPIKLDWAHQWVQVIFLFILPHQWSYRHMPSCPPFMKILSIKFRLPSLQNKHCIKLPSKPSLDTRSVMYMSLRSTYLSSFSDKAKVWIKAQCNLHVLIFILAAIRCILVTSLGSTRMSSGQPDFRVCVLILKNTKSSSYFKRILISECFSGILETPRVNDMVKTGTLS